MNNCGPCKSAPPKTRCVIGGNAGWPSKRQGAGFLTWNAEQPRVKRFFAALLLTLSITTPTFAEDAEIVSVAVLKFGTVNWEMETIQRNDLDKQNGFALEVQGFAGNSATKIAFQGGAADAMVADWIWVARQRAAGKDFVFVPYSTAVGGIAVKADGPIRSLTDLQGKTIGIAGGPLDKSWLILRAYAEQKHGFDLEAETNQVFGAPPLIAQKAMDGEIDAAINYWHFLAKMQANGFRIVAPVDEAAAALGLDPKTPLLGYVFKGDFAREYPTLIDGFVEASRQAKRILAEDEAEWDALRPMMRAKTDGEFEQLKVGFRAGIPVETPVDTASAAEFLALMAELGGADLVGKAMTLPDGVFYRAGE